MTPKNELELMQGLKSFSAELHETATSKGWWSDRLKLAAQSPAGSVQVDIGCVALAITELAEAIENIREGYKPDDKVPQFSGLEAELADCIIRILDFSHASNLRTIEALFAKAEFNKSRTVRHGGKLA